MIIERIKWVIKVLCCCFFAVEGVHGLLMTMEANAAMQTEKKAAEKYRQHQIILLQQQITELEDRRDQLKCVVSQLSSSSVCYLLCFALFVTYAFESTVLFICLLRKCIFD